MKPSSLETGEIAEITKLDGAIMNSKRMITSAGKFGIMNGTSNVANPGVISVDVMAESCYDIVPCFG